MAHLLTPYSLIAFLYGFLYILLLVELWCRPRSGLCGGSRLVSRLTFHAALVRLRLSKLAPEWAFLMFYVCFLSSAGSGFLKIAAELIPDWVQGLISSGQMFVLIFTLICSWSGHCTFIGLNLISDLSELERFLVLDQCEIRNCRSCGPAYHVKIRACGHMVCGYAAVTFYLRNREIIHCQTCRERRTKRLFEVATTLPGDAIEGECPICCNVFRNGVPVLQLPCGHYFCKTEDCALKWLISKSNNCPVCQQDIFNGRARNLRSQQAAGPLAPLQQQQQLLATGPRPAFEADESAPSPVARGGSPASSQDSQTPAGHTRLLPSRHGGSGKNSSSGKGFLEQKRASMVTATKAKNEKNEKEYWD